MEGKAGGTSSLVKERAVQKQDKIMKPTFPSYMQLQVVFDLGFDMIALKMIDFSMMCELDGFNEDLIRI